MAEFSTQQYHIYRLSALDQSVSRQYITIALCFPCDDEHTKIVSERFASAIKRTISSNAPLAGILRTASGKDGAERGYLEIALSLDMVNKFAPTVKDLRSLDGISSYEDLRSKRFPACMLEIAQLAQLPSKPEPANAKAFGAQLNILSGGVVAVFQLHHSVGDLACMNSIVRACSTAGAPRELTHEYLSERAVRSSKGRDLLSDDGGLTPQPSAAPAPQPNLVVAESENTETMTCVLGFDLKIIDSATEMVNARYIGADAQRRQSAVTAFHVLASILWRGVIRARLSASLMHLTPIANVYASLPTSRIIVPVNIRKRLQPELKSTYFGNALAAGLNGQSIVSLTMPIDASTLQASAALVRAAIDTVTERTVRLAIAAAKHSNYTAAPPTPAHPPTDVVITSWSDLLPDEAHLTLNLGEPTFVRKLAPAAGDEGCTIHARPAADSGAEVWEASVALQPAALEALRADEAFMKFVRFADGEAYVNGLTENAAIGQRILVEDEAERRLQRERWRASAGMGMGMLGFGGAGWFGGAEGYGGAGAYGGPRGYGGAARYDGAAWYGGAEGYGGVDDQGQQEE